METISPVEQDYLEKFGEIQKCRDLQSGTHAVDPLRARAWINAQLTPRRRNAAQLFIDNIHYITFNQLFEYLREAIIRLYTKFLADETVYLYTGEDKTGSGYFMSLIGIHLIRQLKYREPIYVNHWNLIPKNGTVFVLDDCVYSGGQSMGMVAGFHNLGFTGKLYICTAAITKYALDNSKWFAENGPNVQAAYIPGIIIPNLFDTVRVKSNRDYLDLRYYFSPFTEGVTPPAIIYFDHKVADDNSTFQKILLLGPVLPGDLQYQDDDFGVYFNMVRELYGEEYVEEHNNKVMRESLAYEKELAREEKGLRGVMDSIPFIKGCDRKFDLAKIPYSVLHYAFNDFYRNLIVGYESRLQEITAKANRCPTSFYKTLFK